MEAEYSVASSCMGSVLHGRFAKRRMNCSELSFTGGCDYVTGEASFEEEASDQGRYAGVRGRRIDFLASGWRISIGCAGSGHTADDESRAYAGAHARRRRNRRRQPGYILSLRQGKHGAGSRRRAARLGLSMRRLPRLPRLRLQGLPLRRLRRLWILLRVMGPLPLLLSRSACWPTQLTNEYLNGRVRQGRPGRSVSAFRAPRASSARQWTRRRRPARFPIFSKNASARTGVDIPAAVLRSDL